MEALPEPEPQSGSRAKPLWPQGEVSAGGSWGATASPGAQGERPGQSGGHSCSREGRNGRAASLQLDQGVANILGRAGSAVGMQPLAELAFVETLLLCHHPRAVGAGWWEMLGCSRQPCCGEGLGNSHCQAQHCSHQLTGMIYRQ